MIRAATKDDELAVKELWAKANDENFLGEPYRAGSHELVPALIARGDVLVYEEAEGKVVGFIAYTIAGEYYSGLHLGVAQERRGNGFAHELLNAAHCVAATRGAKRAVTMLGRDSGLLGFYQSAGYADTGHVLTKEL